MIHTLYILILLLFGLTTYGQAKQGYIDFEKVVQTLPYYEIGQKQLDIKKGQLQDSFKVIATEYQDFLENKLPHNTVLDSVDKASLDNRIRAMEKKIRGFHQYAQTEMTKEQEKIDTTLKDIVVRELEEYCADNHIVCVAEKKAILHCTNCHDFTDDFLDFLNRKK